MLDRKLIRQEPERVRQANRGAISVPLEVLEGCGRLLELAQEMAAAGNPNSLSDAGVAVWCARACAEGAWYNVLINLAGLGDDTQWAGEVARRATELVERIRSAADELAATIDGRLRQDALHTDYWSLFHSRI